MSPVKKNNLEMRVWSPFKFYIDMIFNDLTLVRVTKCSSDTSFNEILRAAFTLSHPETIYGVLDLQTVDFSNPIIAKIGYGLMSQLGWQKTAPFLSGYYLFRKGHVIGYHSGMMQAEDMNAAIGGVLVGLLGNIFTNDTSWWQAAKYSVEWGPAERMLTFFSKILSDFMAAEQAREAEDYRRQRAESQRKADEEEMAMAYSLIGVRPEATDEQVKNAYRNKMKEWHPDGSVSDDVECIKRTKVTAQLNNANDLIRRSRGLR